jgi:hypothetical protein
MSEEPYIDNAYLAVVHQNLRRTRAGPHPSGPRPQRTFEDLRYRHNMLGAMSDRHGHSDIEESCISWATISLCDIMINMVASLPFIKTNCILDKEQGLISD